MVQLLKKSAKHPSLRSCCMTSRSRRKIRTKLSLGPEILKPMSRDLLFIFINKRLRAPLDSRDVLYGRCSWVDKLFLEGPISSPVCEIVWYIHTFFLFYGGISKINKIMLKGRRGRQKICEKSEK